MDSIIQNLITDLRAFMFSTYAQERHTKGHALALIKRLEEITEQVEEANRETCEICGEKKVYRMFEVPHSKDLVERLTCLECDSVKCWCETGNLWQPHNKQDHMTH